MPIAPTRILFEDESLLAANKLSRELSVRGKGEVGKLPLFDFLKKTYPTIHTIHRLDFETSGVMIFAKSAAVLKTILDSDFEGWKKTYVAIVMGVTQQKGEITLELPSRVANERISAHTAYRVLHRLPGCTVVEAEITTGRHHQIRKHFAKIGHPLLLDEEYGDRAVNQRTSRQLKYHHFFLHASKVTLPHPVTGQIITIEAPLPRTFEECITKLRVKS